MSDSESSNRRDFLTGISLRDEVHRAAEAIGDAVLENGEVRTPPASGPLVRLGTRAMACDFHVFLNAGPQQAVETWYASDALELVHQLEDQMTVYREQSELLDINRRAFNETVDVEPRLFSLLQDACRLSGETDGAYDPTARLLSELWRACRREARLPVDSEVAAARECLGVGAIEFAAEQPRIRFARSNVQIDLNGIGKGYALDRASEILNDHAIGNWLLHGGQSSVLARGDHNGLGGWPVGIRNPLFPDERLATVMLRNQAMGTSGSGVQFFRVNGRRYGHVIDPRTGWPADGLLSATVISESAAEADALSTAFFVMGLEKAIAFCQNRPAVRALLIPPPRQGRMLQPVNLGIPDEDLFLLPDASSAAAQQ